MIDTVLIRRALRRGALRSGACLAACSVLVGAWTLLPLPASMMARTSIPGVVIEDRHGTRLRATRATDGSQERWMPYGQIDADIINAFVAVEDRRFWEHAGIDVRAVARAVRENFLEGHVVSGASTITMQLARLMRPARRTWGGKVTQVLWALRIERHLDKQQVLEQYLNRVQLGQATVGIGAASALYFDATASDISMGQAATLAGLAHAPSRDNPLRSPRGAQRRRAYALQRMRVAGYATR